MKKYVWLDMNTGKFSNSWDERDQSFVTDEMMKQAKEKLWKLIEYTALNDDNFRFNNKMRIP